MPFLFVFCLLLLKIFTLKHNRNIFKLTSVNIVCYMDLIFYIELRTVSIKMFSSVQEIFTKRERKTLEFKLKETTNVPLLIFHHCGTFHDLKIRWIAPLLLLTSSISCGLVPMTDQ
jgi:ABC-type multidrug transport system permease subunit